MYITRTVRLTNMRTVQCKVFSRRNYYGSIMLIVTVENS